MDGSGSVLTRLVGPKEALYYVRPFFFSLLGSHFVLYGEGGEGEPQYHDVYPALKGQLIPLSERGHVGEGWLGSSCALLPWIVRVSLSASRLLISFHPHRQLWPKSKEGARSPSSSRSRTAMRTQ